ncbi:MAG: DUF4287 domain-containing protein [Planctomycetes bacterium]|nr:DUF4287 domain-containing protein [Planctomycetota bacterium]
MAKSPEEAKASMIANLKETTGKSIDEWLKITRASKLAKHGGIVKLLKSKHGVTHGYANAIALESLKTADTPTGGDDLVAAQYADAKASLRPLYDALLAAVNKFGPDVEASPKKAYVSLRRNKQFGIIQPSTATRLDVGINLKGAKPAGRLEASGSFNAMVSHRVRISKSAEIDKELLGWLKAAYDAS